MGKGSQESIMILQVVSRSGIQRIDVTKKIDCLFSYRDRVIEVTDKRK